MPGVAGAPVRRRRADPASDPGFAALKTRVIARTGHHYYADKDDLLFDRLLKRFRALGLSDATAYALRLEGPGADAEWTALEAEITIGETFFFRYAEQFAALRQTILPGLIETRAKERRLRIWSAGCSTGAEPYSVAILLYDLLGPAFDDWDVTIVGTDISAAALATAEAAEFGRWALRTMPVEERPRWFQTVPPRSGATREGGYRLKAAYRAMVRFERQNLIGLVDGSVPASFGGFDLILCRNVLIYFKTEAVFGIVRGFSDRLRSGGWLLIGHAEPNPAFAGWLTPINLPGTVAYRRQDEPALLIAAPAAAPIPVGPPPVEAEPLGSVPPLVAVRVAERGDATNRIEPVERIAIESRVRVGAQPVTSGESRLSEIRTLADTGATGEAWRSLRGAIAADPTDAALRLYEGLLALDLGRETDAEKAFRGALFLDRDFVMAHYHLGLLLTTRGRGVPGRRALDNAFRLAEGLAPMTRLPEGDGMTAGDVIENIRLALGRAS